MTKLAMIHGYNHDPSVHEHSPFRPGGNFDIWKDMLPDHEYHPLPWYSAIQRRDLFKAWKHGCWNTYFYSYKKLAPRAAVDGLLKFQHFEGEHLIAHSLGTRVALQIVERLPNAFSKVLLLNGAERCDVAIEIIRRNPQVEFLNIAVGTDDIVGRLGAWMEPSFGKHGCIGSGIPGWMDTTNVDEFRLDDPWEQQWCEDHFDWDIRGDNPDTIGDHSFSFLHEGNWPLYRRFFSDEGIW